MSAVSNQTEAREKSVSSGERSGVQISIIVPVTERCENLPEIFRSHVAVLQRHGYSFEFIVIVDGECEAATQAKALLGSDQPTLRFVQLSRPFGEATALAVGFEQAKGDFIVCLPSYFQTIPDGLETVIEGLEKGYDMVIARRWPRGDGWFNHCQNFGFHFIVRWFTGMTFRDLGCGLRGLTRQVAAEIQLYGDLHRFLPLLAFQKGFRILEVNVPQHVADYTVRFYKPGLYTRRLLDILTIVFLVKFTKKPLRFFGLIGAGLFGMGFTISIVLVIQKIFGMIPLTERPLLMLGVLLMVLGVQSGSIGLLGEIIIFTHARKMKDYAIEKFLR